MDPMPQPSQTPQPNLFDKMNSWFMSPQFQMGAGVMGAGQQGLNLGAAFGQGAQQAQRVQQAQLLSQLGGLQLQSAQRENAANTQRDSYFAGLNPNDPKFGGLPPGLVDLAKHSGADQGMAMLSKAYQTKADLDQQAKLAAITNNAALAKEIELARMKNELELKQIEARLNLPAVKAALGQNGQPAEAAKPLVWDPTKPNGGL